MYEWVWSNGGMMLTGKTWNTRRKIWPNATLSTTNPTTTEWQTDEQPPEQWNGRNDNRDDDDDDYYYY